MTGLETLVVSELEIKGEPMTRFELVDRIGSLDRKNSSHVLRDMEERGLITSRLETRDTPHRLYRPA